MEIQKEFNKDNNDDTSFKFKNNEILDIDKMKVILSKLFDMRKEYRDIIEPKLLMEKLNNKFDEFYKKFNKRNEYSYIYNRDNINIKYFTQFKRNINYINKYFNRSKRKIKLINKRQDISILINSLFIFKKYINENNHIFIKLYIKLLILLQYSDLISLNTFKLIVESYINIFNKTNLIKYRFLKFIDDLIEGVIQFPYKIKDENNNIFDSIMSLLEEYFIKNSDMKMEIKDLNIWQKLLGNKMALINNCVNKNILSNFLINIYKNNININFLFELYKQSIINLDYYLNSIKFLSELFKKEEEEKKNYFNFNIKYGFYIQKNNPLILDKIKFKENEYSIIFSFRLMTKKDKENDNVVIFDFLNCVNGNNIIKFIVLKDNSIKIIYGNKEWNINKVKISENKDYLVCLTHTYKSKLFFFINSIIDNDDKESNHLASNNIMINLKSVKNKKDYLIFEEHIQYPNFGDEMTLELGKNNFNGIIGDFIIINKQINQKDISNLFNLSGYYSYLLDNINNRYDLINKYENFYLDNKENLIFFKKLKFNFILKILSYKINNRFIKDRKEIKIENFGFLKHKENNEIKIIDFIFSIDSFYNKNGIEFLIFQLHNISNIIIKDNNNDNINLFNNYLYETLKFFYDIMLIIDDDNTGNNKKNDSLKFSAFILTLMIILYKYKNKGIYLDNNIYDLLLKYIDFYNIHNYFTHRNIILSLLLDNSLFHQNIVLKQGKILIHLMAIIKNNYNFRDEIFNEEILYKIFNLDFILESKEYHHKLYMKLIMSLLLIKDNKMIYEKVNQYIFHLNNEIKLYHYLKYIYINLDSLKDIIKNDKNFPIFLQKLQKKYNNFHCDYCFKLIFLISQIIEELEVNKEKGKLKINNFLNVYKSIPNKDLFIKYTISLIKSKFISCFNINNEVKLKFIKNNRCFFSSGDNINQINEEQKNTIIHIEINLLNHIHRNRFLTKFNSIINDLYLIYNIFHENGNNEHLNEKGFINNIFEIFHFFFEEINKYFSEKKKISEEDINFLNGFLTLTGIETFFRIYLIYNEKIAINILSQIIRLSINTIKHPFYFNYIEIDENIDKNDRNNNERIKNEITERIIIEIDKVDNSEEIITHNREKLLIIIYEIVKNTLKLSNIIEKYYITFIKELYEKKFFNSKYLYKIKGEYYNLLELSLNILFDIYKMENYDKQYKDLILKFLVLENNKSIFCAIDQICLKDNKNLKSKKQKIDFSNVMYSIYFLLYLIEIKEYFGSNLDAEKINNNINNPNIFINILISILFNNTKEIFKKLNKKNKFNDNNIKTNKIDLSDYISVYTYYCTNINKYFTFEELEKYYSNISKKELKKKSYFKNKYNYIESISNDKNINSNDDFVVINFIEKEEEKEKDDFISKIIVENYITYDNKYNNNDDNSYIRSKSELKFNMNEKKLLKKYSINSEKEEKDENKENNKKEKIISKIFLKNNQEKNNNENISDKKNCISIEDDKELNLQELIEEINIPIFYYQKLISYEQLYFTKILANPKLNLIWKIFNYSLRDIIFNNKYFKQLSKSFKIFSKNYKIEMSSEEENKFHLNYPTKLKNFTCDDYYRPFLKPDLKFFNREYIKISHAYIPKKAIKKVRQENKLSLIKFVKFNPINIKKKNLKIYYCENVSNKGSIFGEIIIESSFIIFINISFKEIIKNNKELIQNFIFSKEDINKYKDKEKIILIYNKEIKEVILRRFCFKYIGYEIFLKDGSSYLFNFFNTNNANDFYNGISGKNKDFLIINDSINYFEKKEYKLKYKKGEINNFQYLLLINKFSTRTYNNNSQYLIFPLIYMNFQENIERNLSKAICLNKDESEVELNKYIMNYEIMKCHFNNHYSTSAYILYYLVRLIPFTYLLIEFQSGKFDVPERIFSTYNNLSTALLTSSENRELIPEFYHNYEFSLNLNYNFIGKMQNSNILINNFNSNKFKNSVEFIINHRKSLDSMNIVPWINNIFGFNQINNSKEIMNIFPLYSYEQYNDFDKDIQKIKENIKDKNNFYELLYREVRMKLAILDLGISPIQLFKSSHPERPASLNNNSMIDLNSSIKNSSKSLGSILNASDSSINTNKNKNEKKERKKDNEKKINELFVPIKEYVSKQKYQKYRIFINNQTMNIFFIFKSNIVIYNIFNSKNNPQIKYPIHLDLIDNLIEIDSFKNICCELMPGFYCICRNVNNTLKLINHNGKYNFYFLWYNIITVIEAYSCNVTNESFKSIYEWKLILGDEEGNIILLECNFEYTYKTSEIKMRKIKIMKKIKVHKDFINNILYNERLNIIVSSSENGDIAINNAYSLEILNFIRIGENYLINNIKISFYDLLYLSCYNSNNCNYYIKCFTLNGIKVTKMKTEKKIINFFINDNVNVFFEDKSCEKYSLYDFKDKKTFDNIKRNDESYNLQENDNEIPINEDYYDDDIESNEEKGDTSKQLIHCTYCNKIKKVEPHRAY